MEVLVLADTHVGPGRGGALIDALAAQLTRADAILHAGDVTDASLLDLLAEHAPVHAVKGNNDHGLTLPETLRVLLDGCEVAMVHDSGSSTGRGARLHRMFPTASAVLFGHSHLPWHEVDVDGDGRTQHHFNPGSPTQRRHAPYRTVGWLTLGDGAVVDARHERLIG